VRNKIGKIAKIFVKTEDPENRGVISGAETFSALVPALFTISWSQYQRMLQRWCTKGAAEVDKKEVEREEKGQREGP
jgi:hypothetical protein